MKKLLAILIAVFCCTPATSAHDGLHEQIVAVSGQIKKDPRNPALYLKRAELYRLHAEWKLSENDFNKAEKLDGMLAVVNLGRGKLWLDAKRFAKARRALEQYLTAAPGSFEGNITMARVCARLRQTDAAVRHFTAAIAIAPADAAEIYLERAETLRAAKRTSEALRGLDEGLVKFPNLVTLQTAAIDLEIGRRNYDGALARLDKLAASMERKESYLLKRGEVLLLAKRGCEARQSLLEAKSGYDSMSGFRKKLRAVREQTARLETLLRSVPARNCR